MKLTDFKPAFDSDDSWRHWRIRSTGRSLILPRSGEWISCSSKTWDAPAKLCHVLQIQKVVDTLSSTLTRLTAYQVMMTAARPQTVRPLRRMVFSSVRRSSSRVDEDVVRGIKLIHCRPRVEITDKDHARGRHRDTSPHQETSVHDKTTDKRRRDWNQLWRVQTRPHHREELQGHCRDT